MGGGGRAVDGPSVLSKQEISSHASAEYGHIPFHAADTRQKKHPLRQGGVTTAALCVTDPVTAYPPVTAHFMSDDAAIEVIALCWMHMPCAMLLSATRCMLNRLDCFDTESPKGLCLVAQT